MVMLTGAFDVSLPQPDRRFLVMAGFVSDAARWTEFDKKWRARIALDGLDYFHMNKFVVQKDRRYRDWPEERRRSLLGDLLDLISEYAYQKFGVVVQAEAAKVLGMSIEQRDLSMIKTAGAHIAASVENWRKQNRYALQAELIFEDGDEGRGVLRESIREGTGQSPSFRAKKDDLERGIVGFTPLQAADILAYEIKQVAEMERRLPRDYQFRFPYEQLRMKHGSVLIIDCESANDLGEWAKVWKHFKEHPLTGKVQ